jgi:hypothetical protein
MKKTVLSFAFSVMLYSLTIAQINVPAPSQSASFSQKFGLTEIKVEYSRPSVKGRKVFGDIVPFGEIWRAGANEPTKFTTTDSITVAGVGLPKGSYVILAKPGATEWEIMFNKNPAASYTNYKAGDDVVSIKVKPIALAQKVESFLISISDIGFNSCNLEMAWENTLIRIPLTNDVDAKVMAQIKQKNDGPTASEYNAMARYYLDNNKDAKAALEFVDKGINKGGETYGNLWLKSIILAKTGDKKMAIEVAKKSIEKAKTANNMDYVRMNEKNIAEWSK